MNLSPSPLNRIRLLRLLAVAACLLVASAKAFAPLCIAHQSRGGSSSESSSSAMQAAKKYILCTGGNKGIGKATCQRLLQEYDDTCVFLASRDVGRGEAAKEDIAAAVSSANDRLHVVQLDTSSDDSVKKAAAQVQEHLAKDNNKNAQLYAIINNAGVLDADLDTLMNVNFWGIQRVTNAFLPLLQNPGGRIVNLASGGGPNFVSQCSDQSLKTALSEPWSLTNGVDDLNDLAKSTKPSANPYGYSKAMVSAYTWWLAKNHPDLIVNCITPGWILTDMTAGRGATNPPEKGAIPPVWLCMSDDVPNVPTGRFYGSDCKRSPYDVYRAPGDPEYQGPDGK